MTTLWPGVKSCSSNLYPVRKPASGNIADGAFAASTASVNPESIVRSPDAGPQKLVARAPVPVHVRIIQRWFCRQWIQVIQAEWHAYGKPEASVVTLRRDRDNLGGDRRRAVHAGAGAVLEIDERHGVILPRHLGREANIAGFPAAVDELYVADVETQIRQGWRCAAAVDRGSVPGRCEWNTESQVRLTTGATQADEGQCGETAGKQGQFAVVLTPAPSSSLAESSSSSLSGAKE